MREYTTEEKDAARARGEIDVWFAVKAGNEAAKRHVLDFAGLNYAKGKGGVGALCLGFWRTNNPAGEPTECYLFRIIRAEEAAAPVAAAK